MRFEKSPRLLEQDRVFRLVKMPEVGFGFPGLQMDVPYGLAVRVFDTNARVPDFVLIAHLAGV
jgi:hypothetical protein